MIEKMINFLIEYLKHIKIFTCDAIKHICKRMFYMGHLRVIISTYYIHQFSIWSIWYIFHSITFTLQVAFYYCLRQRVDCLYSHVTDWLAGWLVDGEMQHHHPCMWGVLTKPILTTGTPAETLERLQTTLRLTFILIIDSNGLIKF